MELEDNLCKENDINLLNNSCAVKDRSVKIDSDSKDGASENNTTENVTDVQSSQNSDSNEGGSSDEINNDSNKSKNLKSVPKRFAVIDSDSEDGTSKSNATETVSDAQSSQNSNSNKVPSTDEINNDGNKSRNLKSAPKRFAVIDSDSEDDGTESTTTENVSDVKTSQNSKSITVPSTDVIDNDSNKFKNASRRFAVINSDSEEEKSVPSQCMNSDDEHVAEENTNTIERGPKTNTKRLAIIDSDSDSESNLTEMNTNEEFVNNEIVYEFNKSGKLVPENNSDTWSGQKTLKNLCDSESSEDEQNRPFSPEPTQSNKMHSKSSAKIKLKVQKAPKEKKMTAKQAIAQRQEICSESQRMLRESRVSLPYHRPKTYSIKEFLEKRSKFTSTLTETKLNNSPSVAMKMSYQQLEIVSKRLEEREKEVQKFYESDNESDENAEENEDIVEEKDELHSSDTNEIKDLLAEQNNTETEKSDVELKENAANETIKALFEVERSEINEHQDMVESVNTNEETEMQVILHTEETNANENNEVIDQLDTVESEMLLSNDNLIELEEGLDDEVVECVIYRENMDMQVNIPPTPIQEEPTNLDNLTNSEKNVMILQEQTTPECSTKNNVSHLIEQEKSQETFTVNVNFDNTERNTDKSLEVEQENSSKAFDNSANSMEYDFNLDDIEDNPEIVSIVQPQKAVENCHQNVEEEHLLRLIKKYDSAPMDETSTVVGDTKISKATLLKEKLGSTIPRLTIDHGQEIDLEEDIVKPSGVNCLMERFLRHTTKKTVTKDKVQLTITNFSQGEIITETVTMSAEPEEEPIVFLEKPGLKLKKLKNELQIKMAQRRSELWKQKHLLSEEVERVEIEDGEKSDYEADIDEEEVEMTDVETTDDEECEDVVNDKTSENADKRKCEFLDEEAGESDANEEYDAESDANDAESDANDAESDANDAESDTNEVNDAESESECQDNNLSKKTSKRTLVCYPAVSDDSVDGTETTQYSVDARNVNASLSTTDTADEDILPPNLPTSDKTPIKSKTQFSFLTPVHHLTGLQSLNSGSKFLNDSPVAEVTVQAEPSPFKEKEWSTELQKKLFVDSHGSMDTQFNSEDVAYVPTESTFSSNKLDNFVPTQEPSQTNTQDLMDICSGSFSSLVETSKEKSEDISSAQSTNKTQNVTQINLDLTEEVKNLEDDELISQLLNEEELEQFKKKFVSPLVNPDVKSGRLVLDSSDEEDTKAEMKRKPQKKLDFSDDESESEIEETEEIELHDDISDDEAENDETSNRVVDYDSEENEIEIQPHEPKGVKPREFFENEAELSESEWGSEDEDEKELDVLEAEQGDADVFDENEVRNDLEKIHMRRVLDQDNQEIKMLQELLLEDGEFHGTGRERQFKWRNIDEEGTEEGKTEDVDTYLDEEECEEQWRKARHEREMFLKKKQDSQDFVESDELVLSESNSQVLKLGQEALRRSISTGEKPKVVPSVEVKKTFTILNTRGSFLARNDKFLTKFAELNKPTTSVTVGASKKTKIVFETRTAEDVQNYSSSNSKKRKGNDGTPKIIKKLRLSSNISPNLKNINRKKQLF